MNALSDKLKNWGHWIVFLILEVASLVFLFRFNAYQGSVWTTQANDVVGRVLEGRQRLIAYSQLGEANRQLMEINLQLQSELDVVRHRLAELEHDSSATERAVASQLAGIHRIPAQVVSNSIRDRENYITINRGLADGVENEMGVVCGTGVVGIVYQAGQHYSLVLPVLNSRSSISCRLHDTEYFGYMKWNGGSPLLAFIDDIPRHAKIKVGEMVETSGFSSVFPAGIFVGKVRRILNSDDGLSYNLEIGLSTDFARLRNVSVIEGNPQLPAEPQNDEEEEE